MSCEAMSLSMAVRLGGSPPCGKGTGAKFSEQVGESDHLIAMRAASSGSKSSAEDAAVFATLVTERSRIARGALVDDGGLRQTRVQVELEFVGRSSTQTKTTLAAGGRAVGLAAARQEVSAARGAHALVDGNQAIVTQRSFPRVAAGVDASTHQ